MRRSAAEVPGNRRQFLTGLSAAAIAGFAPESRAQSGSSNSPADRIGIGLIGVGSRGGVHLDEILALSGEHNLHVTCLCDVVRPTLEKAVARVERAQGWAPACTTRYGDVLERSDVDAVVIATPDFSHGTLLNAALEAGRDVYIEKPMTIDLDSANRALDLAHSGDRVVQAGTQRRSDGHFRTAREVVASGSLGKISRVSASIGFNEPRWRRDASYLRTTDVDWTAYLLHLPPRAFDPSLLVCWQLYRETSNGMPGLWMTHYADAVHMLTGATYPTSASAHGGTYVWDDGREHADTFSALVEYPEGFLFDWGMGLGNASGTHFTVHGRDATLDAERWLVVWEGRGGPVTPLTPRDSTSHMADWLRCLRTRERPAADIESGHQHAVATILAARAFETKRQQRYDPVSRTIAPA